MKDNFFVFLSGPITGLNFSDSVSWRNEVISKFPKNIIGFSPMRGKDHLKNEIDIKDHYDHILSQPKSINRMDYFDVKRSDAILVNLLGTKRISIGTVMEIAWAYEMGKPIVIAMEKNNMHQHAMINECADFVVDNLDLAIEVIVHLLIPNPKGIT